MRRTAVVVVMGAIMTLVGMQSAFAAVASQISVAYNADTELFHGRVSSADAECQAGRTVKVFKETADGRALEGRVMSKPDGHWKIEVMHAHGHYFAVTPKEKIMHTICDRAKSRVVDVM